MNKVLLMTAVGLLATAFAAPLGAAVHCNGAVRQLDVGLQTFYLDDRSTPDGQINHWLYLESNGVEGLQSGGAIVIVEESILFEIQDPCNHSSPDQIVF